MGSTGKFVQDEVCSGMVGAAQFEGPDRGEDGFEDVVDLVKYGLCCIRRSIGEADGYGKKREAGVKDRYGNVPGCSLGPTPLDFESCSQRRRTLEQGFHNRLGSVRR